jgi:hypothetical protein
MATLKGFYRFSESLEQSSLQDYPPGYVEDFLKIADFHRYGMYFMWMIADVIILIGRFGKHIKGYYKVHAIYMTFA